MSKVVVQNTETNVREADVQQLLQTNAMTSRF